MIEILFFQLLLQDNKRRDKGTCKLQLRISFKIKLFQFSLEQEKMLIIKRVVFTIRVTLKVHDVAIRTALTRVNLFRKLSINTIIKGKLFNQQLISVLIIKTQWFIAN